VRTLTVEPVNPEVSSDRFLTGLIKAGFHYVRFGRAGVEDSIEHLVVRARFES
jgi:hypothetical protein